MEQCQECRRWGPCDGHHIVFKGMGGYKGLDYPLNMKRLGNALGCNCHKGNLGPHLNRKKDLEYKRELQAKLYKLLSKEYYIPNEIKSILEIPDKQIHLVFKLLRPYLEGYKKEDIIRRLMGDELY